MEDALARDRFDVRTHEEMNVAGICFQRRDNGRDPANRLLEVLTTLAAQSDRVRGGRGIWKRHQQAVGS